jgi:peptidoglycan hydrolase-like protein with peptidoglycan-binding domain
VAPAPIEAATPPPVSTDLPPLQVQQGSPQLLIRAIQRELSARGFDVGPIDGRLNAKTRAAISAYQSNEGMTVTGAASDELLHHILLGDSVKPASTGSVGAMGGAGSKTKEDGEVKAVQQILADLGYAPGTIDGALGPATASAISAFQRDRKIRQTGRITPELLHELKRVTGRDLTKTVAHP